MIEEAVGHFRGALRKTFASAVPQVQFDWGISDRVISEIGGRLIEDFVLQHLPRFIQQDLPKEASVCVTVPLSGRTMEDIRVCYSRDAVRVELFVDIKGHNQLQRGSRPNLASIRKCIDLYSTPSRASEEVLIFFCRYRAEISRSAAQTHLRLLVLPESFDERHVVLLRNLSDSNLDPANIGSGGQLLLAREDQIRVVNRTRSEFTEHLIRLRSR
ncbi:MAG TPA: hypothetical protein VJ853_11895 [Thermoanaerobaculia bacterium]|nr:hypothetical protein [Thermoanaerobaculia bacterium]